MATITVCLREFLWKPVNFAGSPRGLPLAAFRSLLAVAMDAKLMLYEPGFKE